MLNFVCLLVVVAITSSTIASEPFEVFAGNDKSAPLQPQACVSANGIVHVTFGVGSEVYYCNVHEGKCSVPHVAFQVPNMSLGMRRGPRIAHTGAGVTITAIGGPQGKGKDGDVLAYRSLDEGRTWLGPVRVNDIEASGREGLHAMTAGSEGVLWCVWLDLRERGTKLYASKSADHGATWSKNVLVYASPDGSVCECCHPSIVASGDSIHVLFRNSLKGDRDMYLVSSNDQGATFGDASRLGRNRWKLNACPMDGGMLTMDKDRKLSTVWRRDRSVFIAGTPTGSETVLGDGEQPWIASNNDGAYIVWTSKRDGELLLRNPVNDSIESIHGHARFPVVVCDSQPNSTAYLFWETRTERSFSIMGMRIR